MDETGLPVYLDFADHMGIVLAGEPGAGKSVGLTNIVAHGALSFSDCRLILIDGALVELGAWRSCADVFVGPDINHAIAVLEEQQQVINDRCEELLDTGRRKIVKGDGVPMHLTVIDELAYFSATVGTKAEREKFNTTLRDCSARGRKAAHRYVIATQRPVLPTSSRPRCGTCSATGGRSAAPPTTAPMWCSARAGPRRGYTAAAIDVEARGVGLLLAEGKRVPRRVKAAYLDDLDIHRIAAHAAALRSGGAS